MFFSEASRKLAQRRARKARESFRAEHADTIANAVVPWRLSDTKVVLMVFCLLYGVLCASSLSYKGYELLLIHQARGAGSPVSFATQARGSGS